ncbi:MAG: hypothetical protein JWS11_2376, partial [Cypionkella sp.]|nr:hypothetical protein [Cypionkella sp.]
VEAIESQNFLPINLADENLLTQDFAAEVSVLEDATADVLAAEDFAAQPALADFDAARLSGAIEIQAETPTSPAPERDAIIEAAAYADEDMLATLGTLIAENDQADLDAPAVADMSVAASLIEPVDVFDDFDDAEDDLLSASPIHSPQENPALDAAEADATAEPQVAPALEIAAEVDAAAEDAFDEPNEKIQRARARVIKIRRVDVAPRSPDQADMQPTTSLLSVEAEASLQAELAELEADAPAFSVTPLRPTRPMRPVRPAPVESTLDKAAPAAVLTQVPMFIDRDATPEADAVNAMIAQDKAETAADFAEQISSKSDDLSEELHSMHHAESRKLLEAESDDAAVSRLMAATNSAMDDEESRRRHSAISHLKAAVAATEAERQIKAANPSKPQPDRQDIYRHDLESVVRAKPVDGTIETRAAANAERLSPLVLVSEQRIDRPKPTTPAASLAPVPTVPRVVIPVRPRRVGGAAAMAAMQAMPAEHSPLETHLLQDSLLGDDFDAEDGLSLDETVNFFADGQSFAEFAEKLGANSLPELLEASAVYCAQVLGRPEFSRPFMMNQVESLIDAPDHGREDSLRAFGTLLRQGRIAKVKRGHFSVTDRSPLLAEAKRIAK